MHNVNPRAQGVTLIGIRIAITPALRITLVRAHLWRGHAGPLLERRSFTTIAGTNVTELTSRAGIVIDAVVLAGLRAGVALSRVRDIHAGGVRRTVVGVIVVIAAADGHVTRLANLRLWLTAAEDFSNLQQALAISYGTELSVCTVIVAKDAAIVTSAVGIAVDLLPGVILTLAAWFVVIRAVPLRLVAALWNSGFIAPVVVLVRLDVAIIGLAALAVGLDVDELLGTLQLGDRSAQYTENAVSVLGG